MDARFFYQARSPFNEAALMMDLPNWIRKKVSRHIHREAIGKLGIFAGRGSELTSFLRILSSIWSISMINSMSFIGFSMIFA